MRWHWTHKRDSVAVLSHTVAHEGQGLSAELSGITGSSTYALRACHVRCSQGSKPALASCSQVAAGGDRWLLTAVRGHAWGRRSESGCYHRLPAFQPGDRPCSVATRNCDVMRQPANDGALSATVAIAVSGTGRELWFEPDQRFKQLLRQHEIRKR